MNTRGAGEQRADHASVEERRQPADGLVESDRDAAWVDVHKKVAWALAFAAFGPPPRRPDAIVASWRALVAETPPPTPFGAHFGHSSGNPEWLAGVLSPNGRAPGRPAHRAADPAVGCRR